MMESIQETILQSREEAGLLLGMKLSEYEKSNAVVIGIPRSGVCVAAIIAKHLSLPLDVLPVQRIKHPADDNKSLGSVGLTEVYLSNAANVPQDFVTHQIEMLKSANSFEQKFYHESNAEISFRYKTVIVVDDLLKSSEAMLTCIHEIRKQKPLKIIVAVPIVNAEAARQVSEEVDRTLFLKMEHEVGHAKAYFVDSARISKDEVKRLLSAVNEGVN